MTENGPKANPDEIERERELEESYRYCLDYLKHIKGKDLSMAEAAVLRTIIKRWREICPTEESLMSLQSIGEIVSQFLDQVIGIPQIARDVSKRSEVLVGNEEEIRALWLKYERESELI